MRRTIRPARGVSMVEILISLVIFGLALLPIFGVIGKTSTQVRVNRDAILAMQLAGELIDQVSGMPFGTVPVIGNLPLPNEKHGQLLVPGKIETMLILTALPPDFERILSVEQSSPRTRLIRCTIFWGRNPRHESRWQALMEWSP